MLNECRRRVVLNLKLWQTFVSIAIGMRLVLLDLDEIVFWQARNYIVKLRSTRHFSSVQSILAFVLPS
jgi:hypothetical protein